MTLLGDCKVLGVKLSTVHVQPCMVDAGIEGIFRAGIVSYPRSVPSNSAARSEGFRFLSF